MSNLTKEECIARGIPWHDIRHRKTRRAFWRDYWRAGEYGITIHLHEMEDGGVERCMLLSEVVGDCNARPMVDEHTKEPLPMALGKQADGSWMLEVNNPAYPHVALTDLGRLVEAKIRDIGSPLHKREEGVSVGVFIVMPTHIHMTITIAQDLPTYLYNGKVRRWTLSDIIRGFEKGCTSWWYRLLEGETADEILANPTRRRTSSVRPPLDEQGTPAPSLWQDDGFNDIILYNQERKQNWVLYVLQNAYYWKLRIDYPHLFEHRLHLMIAGTDYSAYGYMLLLRRPERVQVFCHRLARRGQLTDEEWQKATASWDTIRAFEKDAREKKLGRFDKDWYRATDPDATTAIDYTRTEAFRKQKADILAKCEQDDAVIVSPAVSAGEQDIFYSALELGYRCIKLVKDVIPEKGHPVSKDRDYCAHGQLLVLGPWEIKDTNNYASRFGDADSKYAKFHNLNEMAAEVCKENLSMTIDRKTLEECK